MTRRRGKKGDYLMSDDYDGVVRYASQMKIDYWGNMTKSPLNRNLQEISQPLLDPLPVSIFRGPTYEVTVPCDFELQPLFIGLTNKRTPPAYPATSVLGFDPGIGDAEIGCTFEVH